MKLKELVAKNLKINRLRNGLTQEDLAKRARMQVQAVNRLENRPQNLTLEAIEALSKALKIPAHVLLSENDEGGTSPTAVEDLRRAVNLIESVQERLKK